MLLHRLRKKATTAAAAEACLEADLLDFKQDTLTLEEKVARYFEQWRDPVNRYLVAAFGDPVEAEEITQEAFLHSTLDCTSCERLARVRRHQPTFSRLRESRDGGVRPRPPPG